MLNQAQIIGHLGRDPEIRYLPSGEAVANFSVATTEKWKDKATGEMKEATEWHRITAFGRLAEVCGEWLRQGSQVFVQGKITTKKYTDRDGVERFATEIRISEMKMLGGRRDEDGQGRAPQQRQAPPQQRQAAPQRQARPSAAPAAQHGGGFDDMDDDIPF